jgi:hypothetical protein
MISSADMPIASTPSKKDLTRVSASVSVVPDSELSRDASLSSG